jgi:hypothetical protein
MGRTGAVYGEGLKPMYAHIKEILLEEKVGIM